MAKTMARVAPGAVNLSKQRQEGLELSQPLIHQVETLTVDTPEAYLEADSLLLRIRQGRKTWGAIWTQIQEKVVKPLRESLDGTYSINRDIDGPMEQAEKTLKNKMLAFKQEEARQLRAAEEEREREARRLQAEIDKANQAAEAAKNPQVKGRMEAKAGRLQEQQTEVITSWTAPVQGAASSERKVPTPVITDPKQFWAAVGDGDIELDAKFAEELRLWLGREFKKDRDTVASWPGITVEDKLQIVGR